MTKRAGGDAADPWTLRVTDRALLGNKTGTTRLGFAVLLKLFQAEGRFPRRAEDVPLAAVEAALPGTTASTKRVAFLPSFTMRMMHLAAAATGCPRSALTLSVCPSGGWSIRRQAAPCRSSNAMSWP